MQEQRQVTLDCAPFSKNDTQFYLAYGVGGNLWTTFPIFYDFEYDNGFGKTATPISLVSYEYSPNET